MPVGFDIMHLQTLCACHLQLGDQAEADFHKTTGGATATAEEERPTETSGSHSKHATSEEESTKKTEVVKN